MRRYNSGLHLRSETRVTPISGRVFPVREKHRRCGRGRDGVPGEKRTEKRPRGETVRKVGRRARVGEHRNVASDLWRVNTRGHTRRNYTSACKYNEPCVSLWFMPATSPRRVRKPPPSFSPPVVNSPTTRPRFVPPSRSKASSYTVQEL